MVTTRLGVQQTRAAIEAVTDPEIPTLSIADLGIIRAIEVDEDAATVAVTITPTYSGCPAMEVIARDIVDAAADAGYSATVTTSFSPPWTSDWLTDRGRAVLAEAQITPPGARRGPVPVTIGGAPHTPAAVAVACPRCGSADTELISRFGTTACKALHRCRACGDPFDEFKAV